MERQENIINEYRGLKTILISALGVLLASLIAFFYTFFSQTYPKTVARIDVLESKVESWDKYKQDLKADIKEIRQTQKEIYMLIMRKVHQ